MHTPVAWYNTFYNKKRVIAASAGIIFAILLIFMQVGFLDAAKKNASFLYDNLDFDLIIISKGYLSVQRSLSINKYRLIQARNVKGVESTTGIMIDGARWLNAETNDDSSCMVIGVDPNSSSFESDELNKLLININNPNSVLVDRISSKDYGKIESGGAAIINNIPYKINGNYDLGPGLISDGSVIMSHESFYTLFNRSEESGYELGLIKLKPGFEIKSVIKAIDDALPNDIRIIKREDIIKKERDYFVSVKPIGVMFKVGATVAFIIGSVILYQVLSFEITNRINEFATMKAMGYKDSYIYKIGMGQALIFSFLGYLPAFILAFYLYKLIYTLARLPIYMELERALLVLSLTLVMCSIAAVLALRKVKHADPADLF